MSGLKTVLGERSRELLRSRALFVGIMVILGGLFMAAFAGGGDVSPGLASASAPGSRHIENPFEHPEFFDVVIEEPEQQLRRFELAHITAEQLTSLAGAMDIGVRILTIHTNPRALWAQGIAEELGKLRALVAAVDVSSNTVSLNYRTLTARHLPMSRVLELLEEAGIAPERYLLLGNQIFVFDRELLAQARWAAVQRLVASIDIPGAREQAVFVQRLYNISAADATDRLGSMNLPGVSTETFSYPELSREIVIMCPPDMQDEARRVLSILDGRRLTIRVPIDTASGDNAKRRLEARRTLLSELSGVPEGRMHISSNLSGNINDPYYVLWVQESPEVVRRLEELLSRF